MSESPTWKQPSSLVKLRKKKKRDCSSSYDNVNPDVASSKSASEKPGSKKRQNPFSEAESGENKKINLDGVSGLKCLEKEDDKVSTDFFSSLMKTKV